VKNTVTASSPFSLAGSVAAVIGTSANIGTGIALQLAAAGARVACVDKDESLAKHAAAEIQAGGGDAIGIACDVTAEPDVRRTLAAVKADFDLVDILVNGPVVYREKGIRQMPLAEWRQQLSVLLDGTFLFTKHVTEALIAAERPGSVINLVSTAGHQGEPGNIGYATAKGGIVNMTRAAAMDLAPYGIRVNSLTPTSTDPRAALDIVAAQLPLGTLPTPTDYGLAAVFLASPAARLITGIDLPVDAGSLAKYWRVKPGGTS
jgi:NAD(P)-dependent dehydrogenase (short-subunit alcohol dehydrogenase family)